MCAAFFCIVFAGIESTADAAGPDLIVDHGGSHELHGTAHDHEPHSTAHDDDDDGHHDDHFCHCNAHAAALPAIDIVGMGEEPSLSHRRYSVYFTSLVAPPLLRPPNA